jgi:hypothetical protein
MKKSYDLLITSVFVLFLAGMALCSLILPDRSFSELENRNLRPVPELTERRFTSGRYMTEAEEYVSDQLVLRDTWVALKSLGERISGKQENNGIYFAADDTLIRRIDEPDPAILTANIETINAFVSEADAPVLFGLIPSAADIWRDRLPTGAPSADEAAWIEEISGRMTAPTVDLRDTLQRHSAEDIYYHTDHHWTSLGAFYGANAILDAAGLEPLRLSDYQRQTVSEGFLGTNYSSACAWWTEPDTIETYVSEEGKTVTSNFTGREEPGRLYAPERLDTKNQYAYFLGGNQPLCVIRSQHGGPKLLVLRDSYSDCLAPFLSERFGEVHLFDLRYNRLSPADYIREQEIDLVLILYSFETFTGEKIVMKSVS